MKRTIGLLVFAIALIGSMSAVQAQAEDYNHLVPYASVDRFAIGSDVMTEYQYRIIEKVIVPYALAHPDERIELQPFVSTLLYGNDDDFQKQVKLATGRGINVADAIIAISGGQIKRDRIWIYPVVMGISGTPGNYDPFVNQKVDVYFAKPEQPSVPAQVQTQVNVIVVMIGYPCPYTISQPVTETRGGYKIVTVTVTVDCPRPTVTIPGDTTIIQPRPRFNCNLHGRLWTILMPIIGFGIGYSVGDITIQGGHGGGPGGGDGGDVVIPRVWVGAAGAALFLPMGIWIDHERADQQLSFAPGINLNPWLARSSNPTVRRIGENTNIRLEFYFIPAH